MASDTDMRVVLRENGVDVPQRGKLGEKHVAAYERIMGDSSEPGTGETWDGPDDGGPVAVRGADPYADAPPPAQAIADFEAQQEVRPSRPKRARAGGGLAARLTGKKDTKPGKPKKDMPRLPVDRLITRGWGTLARFAAPVSVPLSMTLGLQAPIAGLMLEDTVRGTVVDRFLQPVVRSEERAEKVIALVGPPLIVVAIERAQGLPEPQRSIQLAVLAPMLEEALTLWCQLSEGKVQEAAARLQSNEAVRAQVAELTSLIFSPAPPPDDFPGGPGQPPPDDMAGQPQAWQSPFAGAGM